MFELRSNPGARKYRAAGSWRDVRLFDLVRRHAAVSPDAPALIDGSQTITYRRLLGLAHATARGLLELGVGPGQVVSVQLPNWWEFAVFLLAIERIGAVMNPLTTILRQRELKQMLRLAGTGVMVVPETFRGFSHAAMATELRSEIPSLRDVIVLRGNPQAYAAAGLDALVDRPVGQEELEELDRLQPPADAVCELAFSSGTTGEPKGVLHTHNSAIATVGSTILRQQLPSGSVFHVATPVGHNAGYFYGVRIALQSGGTAVFQDAWDGGKMVELVERHGVTFSMGTTTFLIDLLEAARGRERKLSSLRIFTCGGAPIPPSIAEECERRFPGVLCPVFGMTEMGHVTSTGPDSPRDKAVLTDGSPQPEMELRIVGPDGRLLPPRREGSLRFRGPFLFAGYLQGRTLTDAHFDADGFFDTGDLAYQDEDGYIRITGRAKDIIIRGGENLPVREIEDLLAEHPKVAAVAVVGVPDNRLGERAVACVQPRTDEEVLTLDEVQRFLADRKVTRQFWPERVETFDVFPMTPTGKIQKFELKRLLHERLAAG